MTGRVSGELDGGAPELRTERLLLRPWRTADLEPFAQLNADPGVLEHLPGALTRPESDALAARCAGSFRLHGFGRWAVELPGEVPFLGFVGLARPTFEARFTPCVEIGWRLDARHWGRGYATEGARAVLRHGFGSLGLEEIVSFTVPANLASRRVMEKLGFHRDPAEDFEHPRLPPGHRLRRHVLYRLRSGELADHR